jgi:hypothetical protein
MENRTLTEQESCLRDVALLPASPSPDECLLCYVARMLEFGCDKDLNWTRRWRDLRMPEDTGLERRLEERGSYCDCEVLLNGWDLAEDMQLPDEDGELTWPARWADCAGGEAAQPCANWVPWGRPRRPWW